MIEKVREIGYNYKVQNSFQKCDETELWAIVIVTRRIPRWDFIHVDALKPGWGFLFLRSE